MLSIAPCNKCYIIKLVTYIVEFSASVSILQSEEIERVTKHKTGLIVLV